jgi:uncharacterized protein
VARALGPAVDRRWRLVVSLVAVVGILVGVNLANSFGPSHGGLVFGPAVAVGLVALARRVGLSWEDLGLARRSWGKGALYAGIAVALVAVVYAGGAALPATRMAFLDARYHQGLGHALVTALIVIPLGTVVLEEVAFRGVLLGLLRHHRGIRWATGLSSTLFGLWHILPSLTLARANQAVGVVFGHGVMAHVLAVAAAVGFTGLAGLVFCELRRRSGSVLAAAGLHWATNGLGVLLASVIWAAR